MPPVGGIFTRRTYLFSVLVFALLISDAAAGLASGLARSLAFAATAILCAFAEITSLNGFDMFHNIDLHIIINRYIISPSALKVNSRRKKRDNFFMQSVF